MAKKKDISQDGVIIVEYKSDFVNSDQRTKDFSEREFINFDFTNCILQGCNFEGASFIDCKFDNTDVRWSIGFPEDIIEGVIKS